MFFLRRYYHNIRRHFEIKQKQQRFDEQVELVRQLMADGDIKASGEALLEAERMRKEIQTLEGVEPPSEEEISEELKQAQAAEVGEQKPAQGD
ncbi:MAG: hypothetical protein ACQES2_03995 [Pseudomonadota bacterium]